MFFCAQMQRKSQYYKVIVHHAFCMDAEYAIKMLLVKSVKIVKKTSPQAKNRVIDLLVIMVTTLVTRQMRTYRCCAEMRTTLHAGLCLCIPYLHQLCQLTSTTPSHMFTGKPPLRITFK